MRRTNSPTPLESKIITGLLFVLILLVLFVKLKTPFNFYDEGFALFTSTRVIGGDVPYRDFWAIYPPGQFYTLAGLFKGFGANILPSRIYDTLLRFVMVVGVFLILRKTTSQWLALLGALIAGLMLASAGFYSYAVFPAMCLGIWAVLFWWYSLDRRHNIWLLFSGILLGIAAVIRWDIGLYAAISILVPAYLYLLFCANPASENNAPINLGNFFSINSLVAPFRTLTWVFTPMLAIALLAYGWMGFSSGWSNLYDQVFYFPTSVLHSVRWLPYPPLIPDPGAPFGDWLRFYLPILILGSAAIAYAVLFVNKRRQLDREFYAVVALILFGGLLFNQALSRYDYIHVIPASILTFMVAVSLVQRLLQRFSSSNYRDAAYLLLLIPTLLYWNSAVKELSSSLQSFQPWGCYSHLEKADCVALDPNQEKAVEYIQARTGPLDPIFVGNQKHDRIFVSDIGFYYLVDRPSATRYHELYPGVATGLPVQTEIAREIEAKKVSWIVLVDIWDSTEPNASALSSGVKYLDEYLGSHYQPVTAFGNYRIMKRR